MPKRLLAALFVSIAGPACASGGVWCDVDDGAVTFSVHAATTRGSGAVFDLEGKVELKGTNASGEWANTAFSRNDLAQFWFDGSELRLLLYKENTGEPFSDLTVEIRASSGDDEDGYDGRYSLRVYRADDAGTVELEGEVSCSAD